MLDKIQFLSLLLFSVGDINIYVAANEKKLKKVLYYFLQDSHSHSFTSPELQKREKKKKKRLRIHDATNLHAPTKKKEDKNTH